MIKHRPFLHCDFCKTLYGAAPAWLSVGALRKFAREHAGWIQVRRRLAGKWKDACAGCAKKLLRTYYDAVFGPKGD